MTNSGSSSDQSGTFTRTLVTGLVVVIVIMGFSLIAITVGTSHLNTEAHEVNALAGSQDSCVRCHGGSTPGIIEQYGYSAMAVAGVTCRDCHQTDPDYPGSHEHAGTWVLASPTPAICEQCHVTEVTQFYQSRHAAPAYAAMVGTDEFSPEQLAMYEAVLEGAFSPDKMRNALYALEGPEITEFACHRCHDIGKPQMDGSIGKCQSCHLRHEFSLEQVRKPETCNACHIGPDHPQWEIYQESPHGISYMTTGHEWHWDAAPGSLEVTDFPAPQCATCHISGFGTTGTSHDVGERLSWYLFAPQSERRPEWEANKARMQAVCAECHNIEWIEEFYMKADAVTERVNEMVAESDEILAMLEATGRLTPDIPFDQSVDFTHFDLWHAWGRTAKMGTWMQGADYVQWHGAYELMRELVKLKELAAEYTGTPVSIEQVENGDGE